MIRRFALALGLLTLGGLISVTAAPPAEALAHWPQWRGPLATGFAPQASPPVKWGETENVKWKVSLPGFGTSTPIIWGDRVFIHTAIPVGTNGGAAALHQFVVLCLDRPTGKTLWQKTVREVIPHEGHHRDHGFASASPITDGTHLLAHFGSRGLHCLDLDGNLKWSKDFGQMKTRNSFGEGASPALHGNTVVVCWDDETDNDFVAALDKTTGKELWRTPRREATGWSTPLIVEPAGKAQVIVNATTRVCGYDLASGQELWSCTGQTANAIPSPVADADTVYVTSGFRGNALVAVALGRAGDLTGTDAVRWSYAGKNTPYVPSPLLANGLLYTLAGNNAVLACFNSKTGATHFEGEKLEALAGVYASPVSAQDRVYVLGRNGVCLVLKQGPKLEILATNTLDEKTDASIALVGKDLFIRGHQRLYCIAGP